MKSEQTLTITKKQARQFLVSWQGLGKSGRFEGEEGIRTFVKQAGCIQFDPLNVVGRNQDLVLQARIPNFTPSMLNALLYEKRKLLDGWDKNMSIYSSEDWPLFERHRKKALEKYKESNQSISEILPAVREALKKKGPLSSKDLEHKEIVENFWAATTASRAALERMFFWGELIVYNRVGTRKIYDFAHKHIAKEILETTDPNITDEQYFDWNVLRRISSVGLLWAKAGGAWLGILNLKSKERQASIKRLLEAEKIIEVTIESIKFPFYMKTEAKPILEAVLENGNHAKEASILAPLDNMLWDRDMVQQLFDFDYRWEVYKPVSERKYGYYVLPVLLGDRFIGRFDSKMDQKTRALTIHNWWWEPEISLPEKDRNKVKHCFENFKKFLNVESIKTNSGIDKEIINLLN